MGKEWPQRGVIRSTAGDGDRMLTGRGDAEPERGRAREEKGSDLVKMAVANNYTAGVPHFSESGLRDVSPKTPAGSGA